MLRSAAPAPQASRPEASFALGALTLVLWIAIGWVLWNLLDRFDAHIYSWAMFLNSRFNAGMRGSIFTYDHLQTWLNYAAWTLRWVLVPGLLLPLGCTALFALRRAPWRRVAHVWIAWRWWLVILVLALLDHLFPQALFHAGPTGSVQAQIARVTLKLIAFYSLAVLCWIVALAWSATLLIGNDSTGEESGPGGSISAPESNRIEGRPLPIGNVEDHLGGNA
jgi:hypothetical protein